MAGVSSLGLMTQSVLQIQNVQLQLSELSNQLATGKKSLDLSDYSLADSNRILSLRTLMTKKQSFLDSMSAVEPQIKLYDTTLDKLTELGNQAMSLVNQATGPAQVTATAADTQFQGIIDQVQYYLNQRLGDRYVFGGARFGVAPLADLNGLAAPTNTTIVSSPVLPEYDTDAPGSDATTYTQSTVKIDDGFTITFGVSSNDPAMQRLILGLRWAYEATQQTDQTAFTTAMTNARTLISQGIDDLRGIHGEVVSNISQIETARQLHRDFLSTANGQIEDIQNADTAEVATKISFAQAQLQASYSVTAKIASLSLVNYLS